MFLKALEDRARDARPRANRRAAFEASHLEVRLFHVGHGEAILVIFGNNRAWLIDAGSNSERRCKLLGERLIAYLDERDLTLEALVPSHPHRDHAGTFETILGSSSPRIASPLMIYRSADPSWHSTAGWRKRFRDAIEARQARGDQVVEIVLGNAHREVSIADRLEAHLFAGSGEGPYTTLFVHLRFRDARLLFTGDALCGYEIELLDKFGPGDFRADMLKVTHHGSSSGTAQTVVEAVRPAIAIASTGDGAGHRLERDTLDRLGGRPLKGRPGPRRIFETLVDGDIVVRTDGNPYGGGILYQVEFESPGRFVEGLGAEIMSLKDVDSQRTASDNNPECA